MLVEIWYNWKCIQLTTQELSDPGVEIPVKQHTRPVWAACCPAPNGILEHCCLFKH